MIEDNERRFINILGRLNSLMMDHTEYACLKALVLFKPGVVLSFISFFKLHAIFQISVTFIKIFKKLI